jgi:SNF2 family DNA or RNA helicase
MKNNEECKIMICGLKVGSVGLNWTWANHVIIADPWWNKCVEMQAFCRTHRLGQEKNTHLVKLAVQDSVDERLLDMQAKKCRMIARTTPKELTSDEMEELLGRYPRRHHREQSYSS